MRSLVVLMVLMASLWAIDTGSLSFYLMKDGKPLASQQVLVFKKSDAAMIDMPSTYARHAEFITDSDGYIESVLPVGSYNLQLIAKDKNIAQAAVKKNFVIKKNRESQIIVSLKEDNTVAFEDVEAPEADKKAVVSDSNLSKVKGSLQLTLRSAEDQKTIKDARVFVQGQSVDVKSAADGSVALELLEGEYTLSI
ncbi:MAG: hypothetical protein IBX43_10780, partial [Campylobacterales bacterium]|nr:hypothetical protein [Campylobacterales bacterium]